MNIDVGKWTQLPEFKSRTNLFSFHPKAPF